MTSYGASKERVLHLSKPPHVEVGSVKTKKMFSLAFGFAFGSCPTVLRESLSITFSLQRMVTHLDLRDVKNLRTAVSS